MGTGREIDIVSMSTYSYSGTRWRDKFGTLPVHKSSLTFGLRNRTGSVILTGRLQST